MKVILSIIWRGWFYVAVALAIVLLFPFIFITSWRPAWYPLFFKGARVWGWLILLLSGLWPRVTWLQRPPRGEVYIICPNHTSMIDIMMTFALFPDCFLFIGKVELTRLPLFGYFYKKTNILVDRQKMRSRQRAFERGAEVLREGIGLCIFPEGGVPKDDVILAAFKPGAFRLAVEQNVPVVPVSYPDNKRHLPFDWRRGGPGVLRAVIHPALRPGQGPEAARELKEACYQKVKSGLQWNEKREWINETG